MEIWKDIPSVPGWQASSCGRVKCLPFEAPMPHGGFRTYGGKPRKGSWAKGSGVGRYIVRLGKEGVTLKVARMVCEAFHGPPPPDKPVCIHRDEDSRNNRPGNLKWGTQKENLNAPGFIEYCKGRTGENNPYVKGRRARHADK